MMLMLIQDSIMVKKRGLGKPLDALLFSINANHTDDDHNTNLDTSEQREDRFIKLPIAALQRGAYQPRRDINDEALEELTHSIRMQGIIQPLIVRSVADHQYEIIAGERR